MKSVACLLSLFVVVITSIWLLSCSEESTGHDELAEITKTAFISPDCKVDVGSHPKFQFNGQQSSDPVAPVI